MSQAGTHPEHLAVTSIRFAEEPVYPLGLPYPEILDRVTDAVSMLDQDWRYVYVNATAIKFSGLTKEHLIGRTLWEIFPGTVGTEFDVQARLAMAEQRPVTFEFYFAPFARWYEQRLCPTPNGLLFFTTDIQDRKRLDRQVQEGEERYRHLFEVTNDGILIVDDQGRYVDVNGSYCRFLNTTRERLIGAHFSEFIPPERLEEASSAFADLKSGRPTPVDFPLRATDGSIVELEWNSYSHYLPNLSFCICRNRTEARRAQAALQAAEERQRRAVEAGKVGLWEWDIEKNTVTWSDHIYELHGVVQATFPGTVEAFAELVDVRDRARVSEALDQALVGKADYRAEYRAIRPDGRISWLQTSGKVTFREDGRPAKMHGAVIDCTERKLAEEAQKQIERQLMLLVEASGALLASPQSTDVLRTIVELAQRFVSADGHAVWRQDLSDGWRLSSSAGLSDEFVQAGLLAQQGGSAWLLAMPLIVEDVSLEAKLERRKEPLMREGIRSMLVIPLRIHGAPVATVVFYWKAPHQFQEPEIRIASALGNLAASALGTAALYEREFEVRGEAEAAERRSRFLADAGAMLSSSLEYDATLASVARLAIPIFADWASVDVATSGDEFRRVAVAHRDPEKIRFADEFAKRYPPGEGDLSTVALRTGQSFLIEEVTDEMIVGSARDEEHLRLVRELGIKSVIIAPMVTGGRSLGLLTFVTAESGKQYHASDLQTAEELARRAAVALENARLYRESRVAHAKLQTANEELRRANEDLNQFAYSASHDLQEPLRMIQIYCELLKRRYANQLQEGEGRRYLGYIVKGAERLERLLRDLLAYTQTAYAAPQECGMLASEAVFRKAVANLESSIVETNAEVSCSELPVLRIQEVHLLQLFQNLIGNALKYKGPAKPRIDVSARRESDAWVFAVKDNGIGVGSEYRLQIFTLFKRLHSPDEYPGTGVGLAICQKIVERYGGRIWVDSVPGEGSTFFFAIPA